MHRYISNFAWIGLIIATYLCLQPQILSSTVLTFSSGHDQHLIINPMLSYASKTHSFFDPRIRLWNGEFDLYHAPHTTIFYPFYFLWLQDTGDLMGTAGHMFKVAYLHHVIAGISAFILARVIGVRSLAAFGAAVFFMFVFNSTLLTGFTWRLAGTIWIPLGLAGVWLVMSGRSFVWGVLIGAPAVALIVFANSTVSLVYFTYCAALLSLPIFIKKITETKTLKPLVLPSIGMLGLAPVYR